jgi:hypothetical protein
VLCDNIALRGFHGFPIHNRCTNDCHSGTLWYGCSAREPEPDRSDWKKKETTPAGAPDRPRLKLAARTVPVESADSPANGSSAEDSAASKVNPFGGARPVAVKEVEDKPEAKPEAKEERKQREAPVGPRPSDADSWGKKEAPASRDVAPKV